MNDIAIFTIVSNNYIPYARVLMRSIQDYHDDVDIHLVLADELDASFHANAEVFTITEARALGIPHFQRMAFKYDIVEFNTAIKPFGIKYLFGKGYKKVIYFDPDIRLYHDLQDLFQLLDKYSIILTPHMTTPLPADDHFNPMEQAYLLSGTYNLGFLALSASEDTNAFLRWWCEKCHSLCYAELESGLFVDQKWINQVPGYWSSVHILRHKGYNVAYWNLHERTVNGQLINNDVPLIFYHFSGIVLHDLNRISKYQDRFTLEKRRDLAALFENYRDLLIEQGFDDARKKGYKYGFYSNGSPVGPIARRLFAAVSDLYEDPFLAGKGSYYERLNKRRLLERSSVQMQFVDEIIANDGRKLKYRKLINSFFKVLQRVLGIRLYHFIMIYLMENGSIRKQNFLVK